MDNAFYDLREYIDRVKELGELKIIEGADWNLEIGVISELHAMASNSPLLMFDKIKGYPPGYRVISNLGATSRQVALSMGLPLEARGIELVRAWRDRSKDAGLIPPVYVASGPVMENIQNGKDVDLFKFPSPKWHELDGGRYIGTGDMTITRDPDTGWVNLGTYRVQVHDRNVATVYISPGKDGDLIRRKYWSRGKACPAAICLGQEPLVAGVSTVQIPFGISEYDYAGGMRGAPVEVIKGEVTGLPIPASAEIVLEGEILPPGTDMRKEGPFGEWTGYYASSVRDEPAFIVKSVMHRNDPIILGSPPMARHIDLDRNVRRAAIVWEALDKAVPNIKGTWMFLGGIPHFILVISLKQSYSGHAKQAAMVAAGTSTVSYNTKFIIVVDEDIDPSNTSEVLWALASRTEPQNAIDIIRDCWSGPLDPILSPQKRMNGDFSRSMAIILACKPYSWIKDFPKSIYSTHELLKKVNDKWGIVDHL